MGLSGMGLSGIGPFWYVPFWFWAFLTLIPGSASAFSAKGWNIAVRNTHVLFYYRPSWLFFSCVGKITFLNPLSLSITIP